MSTAVTRGDGDPRAAGVCAPPPDPYVVFDRSPAMRAVIALARVAAASRAGVLVCGEPGTGREAVARAIHAFGARPGAPFVRVDCAEGSPRELALALFGGAEPGGRRVRERIGRASLLEQASGGSLLLFNPADAPMPLQAALARVFGDRGARADDGRFVELDIRPIGILESRSEPGSPAPRLHPDLHGRLVQTRIDVPALSRRREDIPLLTMHLLREIRAARGAPLQSLSRSALLLASALQWRGNGRELRALLECLAETVKGPVIRLSDVLKHVRIDGGLAPVADAVRPLKEARELFEREYISAVLAAQDGRVGEAARVLGIQRTNLYRKVRQLNIARPAARP